MKIEENFQTDWVIELLKEQEPDRPELIEAFLKCQKGFWKTDKYVYFVNPENANEPGAEWQFFESIELEDSIRGDIVIDILRDNRIGGIEFLSNI